MLEINSVTKKYDDMSGIGGIELLLEDGSIYSFVGPNGAGKTSLVKCIAGLMRPDEGEILLNGISTIKRETKKYIGYVPDAESAYPELKLGELLNLVYRLKFDTIDRDDINYYLERYELQDCENKFFSELSMGMKKKAELIMSLMGDPDLVLLDEPTNGVDATGIIRIKEDIMAAKKRGATVLITSHMLDFLINVTDICYFMDRGVIVRTVDVNDGSNLEEIYKEIYNV